jgi:hypothetical protein
VICRIYDVEGGTLEDYDTVIRRVGLEKPEGAHAHIAGRTEHGLRVIEVWDSPKDAERYMKEGLDKAMEDTDIGLSEAGLPEPTITEFEVHHLDWLG